MSINELFNKITLKREERKTFPKHFLASVHCEIRSTGINSVLENKESLKQVLCGLGFIDCQDINQVQMGLSNNIEKPATLIQTPLGFKFISYNPKREIHILNGTLTVSDFAYDNLEKFLARFNDLFTQLKTILNLSENSPVEKVGLRKIDSIIIKPVTNIPDSLNIFNSNLFSIARSGLTPMDSFNFSEESIVLEKQEQFSIIRTKLVKKAIDTLEANLDFDLISRSESNFKEVFSKTLKILNQTHFDLFMWSVTKEMIKLMETP